MIEIDASGGGQMLRTALSLSAITGIPLRVYNIRKKREKPGLRYQHLAALRSVRKISRGSIEGDYLGSEEIIFEPGKIVGGKYEFDITTAGSTTLLAQTIIPILLKSNKPSTVEISGGTFNKFAPSYDHFLNFIKLLNLMGYGLSVELLKPGYAPLSKGKIRLKVKPGKFHSITNIPREEIVTTIIRISSLPFHIALREKKVFVQNNIEDVRIIEDEGGVGNVVFAKKGFIGIDVLGEKGKRAEVVAKECIEMLREEKGEVDRFTADQLMIYLSLGGGSYTSSFLTDHMVLNAKVIEKFLSIRFDFKKEGGLYRVNVKHI